MELAISSRTRVLVVLGVAALAGTQLLPWATWSVDSLAAHGMFRDDGFFYAVRTQAATAAPILTAAVVSIPSPPSSDTDSELEPVPEYAELHELPGIVVEPTTSVTRQHKGMEWSSVEPFDGELLLLDDRQGPVEPANHSRPALAPEADDARGLVLFRLELDSSPARLERAWSEPFLRDVVEPGHAYSNLQAMAARGPHLYILGSHSPRRDGAFSPPRQVAIRLTAGPGRQAAFHEIRLRDALLPLTEAIPELSSSVSEQDIDPQMRNWQLDIQALSRLPGTKDLLVGLRNPTVSVPGAADPRCRAAAVVLRLHDPDLSFDAGTRARLSPYAFLCLGGRGVAGLAFDADSDSYLVAISRKPGGKGSTSLWQWDPRPCATPSLREIMRFTHLRLEGVARLVTGHLQGKLALAFDSHYYAGARRPQNTNEGSFVVIDHPLPNLCHQPSWSPVARSTWPSR